MGLFAVLSNEKLVRENRTMKDYKIAVAGTGARDIIGSTKKTYDN